MLYRYAFFLKSISVQIAPLASPMMIRGLLPCIFSIQGSHLSSIFLRSLCLHIPLALFHSQALWTILALLHPLLSSLVRSIQFPHYHIAGYAHCQLFYFTYMFCLLPIFITIVVCFHIFISPLFCFSPSTDLNRFWDI